MGRRMVTLGVIILFLVGVNLSASFVKESKEISTISFDGNTLYVGGSGPGNYTTIQDAIDDATDGDTVFVYNGVYEGGIVINKSIILQGENREKTIIDDVSLNEQNGISIIGDGVKVAGFTIRNVGNFWGAIYINSYDVVISGNIFSDYEYRAIYINRRGIVSDNIFLGNMQFAHNRPDIEAYSGCVISNNTFIDHDEKRYSAIFTHYNNSIEHNSITGYFYGIKSFLGDTNQIFYNNISNCNFGIYLTLSGSNDIKKNNFIDNNKNAFFNEISWFNKWDSNYWGRARSLPYPIIGSLGLTFPPWVNFDWNPASEPYDIEVL